MSLMAAINSVCPELVEGLSSFFGVAKEEQGFDKLSPNGFQTQIVRKALVIG